MATVAGVSVRRGATFLRSAGMLARVVYSPGPPAADAKAAAEALLARVVYSPGPRADKMKQASKRGFVPKFLEVKTG
jgi:hypothetical protein